MSVAAALLLATAFQTIGPPLSPRSSEVRDPCSADGRASLGRPLLERLNRDRLAQRLRPLSFAVPLCVVAQKRADEIITAADPEFEPLPADEILARAEKAGYEARFVAELAIQVEGDVERVASSWKTGSSARSLIFREDLADLGLGIGRFLDMPLYVFVFGLTSRESFKRRTGHLADPDRLRIEMLERINAERRKAGQRPLRASPTLQRAAQSHAEDMLARSFYGHESPDGKTPAERAHSAGYRSGSVAENIARGQFSVEEVMKGWMESEVHRRNILAPSFSEVGFGFANGKNREGYQVFWVQLFGDPEAPVLRRPGIRIR